MLRRFPLASIFQQPFSMVIIMTTKPIQTAYKGYNFRSRLEARWAVFFDQLNISYEYEPEGYNLGNGLLYLPDFLLGRYFIEIKPKSGADKEEQEKARLLSQQSTNDVIIVCGDPLVHTFLWYSEGEQIISSLDSEDIPWVIGFIFHDNNDFSLSIANNDTNNTRMFRGIKESKAACAARSARFEHGESGATL